MQRILITGANGFIGSNLCRFFHGLSYDVLGLVRKTSDLRLLDGLDVPLVRGDLSTPGGFQLPRDLDFVVHAAGLVSDTMSRAAALRNIRDTTVNLVDALERTNPGLRRFIYISTALVLGHRSRNISPGNPGRAALGARPYAEAKGRTEAFLLERHRDCGFPVVILRPGDVFGPYDRTSSGRILDGIRAGWPAIAGRGNRVMSFCWVGNLAAACRLACEMRGKDGAAYTVTNGQEITWRELMGFFQMRLGRKQWIFVPVILAYAIALAMQAVHAIAPSVEALLTWYRVSKVGRDTTYDISTTMEDLGYRPDQDIERQLDTIMSWYLEEKRQLQMSRGRND
ncbi:MAG TPA: NAD-dependent epimerase/dehydratase family protein [Spirochaetia bacterium]|nr:NAD-dependent epimerase/dehydratase family protein [Spirochaetia bacterium]